MFLWTWLVVLNVSKRGRQMWITEEQVRWITIYMSIMPLWLMKWFCEIEVTPASLWSLKLIAEIYMLIYVPLVLTYIAGLKKNWIFLVGFYHPVFSSDYIFQNHQKGRFVYFTPLSFLGGCPSQRSSVLFFLFFFLMFCIKKFLMRYLKRNGACLRLCETACLCVCVRESQAWCLCEVCECEGWMHWWLFLWTMFYLLQHHFWPSVDSFPSLTVILWHIVHLSPSHVIII